MSYSFTIFASTKEKAKAMVAAKLDEVLVQQPVHRADRKQAFTAASAFIDVCEDPGPDEELSVSVHGSVTWDGDQRGLTGPQVRGAGVGVTVAVMAKRALPA